MTMAVEEDTPRAQARLLGGFAVLWPGEQCDETPWERYDTTSQVLKYLLLQPRLRCHPSAIVDALWPDVDADKALERLQFHVKRLRALLRPERAGLKGTRLVALDKTMVALDAAVFGPSDVAAFSAAAAHALAGEDAAACRAALALYGGELLPHDMAWPWTGGRRRDLEDRRLALLNHAARLLYAAGHAHDAIPLLADLLAGDPCDEPAARLLMECYHTQGERAAAARVYHTLRARLQEELHVLPGARTEELYAAIRHAPVEARSPARTEAVAAPAQRRRRPRPTELGQLLGRDDVLSYLDLLLHMVQRRGGGYTLFVQGEAGIGKTHLAHEMLNRARRHGYSVLAGFARAGGAAPYAPLVEALRVHTANASAETLRALLSSAPGLATLIPELAARLNLPAPAVAGDDLLRRDLVHALLAIAPRQPIALLLDDLHDADAATLAWLGDLLLAGSAAGLLVIATVRTAPPAAPALDAIIEECRRRGTGETLDLAGLPAAVAQDYLTALLGRAPTPDLAAEIHAKTAGNPFLMAEIARELRARGALEAHGPLWGRPRGRLPVPESVRGLARARLAGLDREARRLAALAAVAGTQPVAVLARLAGWPVDATLDLLDQLVAAGIFEEREGYRFRHEMLREAVYEAQSEERRALLHAAVAAALEPDYLAGRPGAPDVAVLAHHFLLGDPSVTAQAARYAALAGDRAAILFAHSEAATYYRAALERTADGVERVTLRERLGMALAAAGDHAAAAEAFRAALLETDPRTDALPLEAGATDPLAHARLLWRLGAALLETGLHSEAARRLAEADATLRGVDVDGEAPTPSVDHALLLGRLRGARARLALESADLDTALDLATAALSVLEPLPEAAFDRLEVRNALAGALYHRGHLDDAQRYLEAQLPDAQALGHPDMLCRLHANRGLILLLKGDIAAALHANDEASAVLGGYHHAYRRTHLLADRGEMETTRGEWDDAQATLNLVIAAAERESWPQLATRAHADMAVSLTARGQLDAALEHLEKCIAAATRPGFQDEVPLIMALVRRAALNRGRGQLDTAAADLERAHATAEHVARPQELADVYLGLSALCAARGDDVEAARHARAALELAVAHGFTLYRGRAGVALAHALARGEPRSALATLDDAIAVLRACDARPELAVALTLRATLSPDGAGGRAARAEAESLRQRLGIQEDHAVRPH